jgi:alanyl-tRNA synthetase
MLKFHFDGGRKMYFTRKSSSITRIKNYFQKDGHHFVELFDSPFYPDGSGGQIGDRGFVGEAKVLYVYDDSIELDSPLPSKSEFKAVVDEQRRKEIARQHTAQHILSAAIEKVNGAKTVGFHMGENDSTIDLDLNCDLRKAELLSNEIVLSDIEVEELIVTPEEATKFNLRKDLSEKAIKSGNIRIIKIGDFDLSACGGFHTSKSGEVGFIKVIHTERVKGGLLRVWFVAGLRALDDYSSSLNAINESAKLFDASWTSLTEHVKKCIDESKEKSTTVKKLSESLAQYISKGISAGQIIEVDESVASFLLRIKQDIPYALKIAGTQNISLCLPGLSQDQVMNFAKSLGAKGGGKGPVYHFKIDNVKKFEESFFTIVS